MKQVYFTVPALNQLKRQVNLRDQIMLALGAPAGATPLAGSTAYRLHIGAASLILEETAAEITLTKIADDEGKTLETVTITKQEYQDLIDARDNAIAMREVATGLMPVLSREEAEEYVEAATPLAFWRKHRGLSLPDFARQMDISQPYLAQLESGKRLGDVKLYAKIAKSLQLRIEDLISDD